MRCQLAQLSRHGSDELGLTQTANISPAHRPRAASAEASDKLYIRDKNGQQHSQNGSTQPEAIAMVVLDNGKGSNGSVVKADTQPALNEIRPFNTRVQVSHV